MTQVSLLINLVGFVLPLSHVNIFCAVRIYLSVELLCVCPQCCCRNTFTLTVWVLLVFG